MRISLKIAYKCITTPFRPVAIFIFLSLSAFTRNGHAPAAIVNTEAEAIIATGAIIGGIPMIDRIDVPLARLSTGIPVTVDGDTGSMEYDGEPACA